MTLKDEKRSTAQVIVGSRDGSIQQINASFGGVPKRPLEHCVVGVEGLEGDFHNDHRNHGGPERALCLYTLEAIQTLQAEGHPVSPGALGENITLEGIDLALLTPGTRMLLGDDVEIEITSYTTPCKTVQGCFSDGDFQRILQKRHPGESRVYARVVRGGELRPGQRARLL